MRLAARPILRPHIHIFAAAGEDKCAVRLSGKEEVNLFLGPFSIMPDPHSCCTAAIELWGGNCNIATGCSFLLCLKMKQASKT